MTSSHFRNQSAWRWDMVSVLILGLAVPLALSARAVARQVMNANDSGKRLTFDL